MADLTISSINIKHIIILGIGIICINYILVVSLVKHCNGMF